VLDVGAAVRQARSLDHVAHRPWPVPERRWTLGQTWDDLLFAHWRRPLDDVRTHVPRGLEVDVHDGAAWIGVTPFRFNALRGRGLPPLPGASSFLELNVRTYVLGPDGRPGIWFFSLDASSRLAVEGARRGYRLPYFHARMSAAWRGGWLEYECVRRGEPARVFSGRYRPVGETFTAAPGSLEWFFAERYCLYTTDRSGALYRAEIHHDLWPLQRAEAEIDLASISLVPLEGESLPLFSRRQDVVVWSLERVAR
jgi:uncharacterized protein